MTHFASASTEINESAMPAIRMRFPNHWCPIKLFEKRDFLCYKRQRSVPLDIYRISQVFIELIYKLWQGIFMRRVAYLVIDC